MFQESKQEQLLDNLWQMATGRDLSQEEFNEKDDPMEMGTLNDSELSNIKDAYAEV